MASTGGASSGVLIGERYRLESSIGSGGMGCVHVASDTFTGGTVAIKTLRPDLREDELVRSRLLREASVGAKLKSRHVVRTLDHGEDARFGPFIVFEYLRGESLADVLDRRRTLGVLESVAIVIDVLEGLSAFHAAGLVHRDLKPDNVFLVRERSTDGSLRHTARLIDFGLSRAIADTHDGTERVTMEGIVAGTPEYMAPEQIADAVGQDQHVDLYATGVMLYQMVSGKLPYRGAKAEAIFDAVLQGVARRLDEIAPVVDPGLARIVHRAMARDPANRFRDTAEMLDALRRWIERHREGATITPPSEPTQKLRAIPRNRATTPRPRPKRKHRSVIAMTGTSIAVAVATFFAWPHRTTPPAARLHGLMLAARVEPALPIAAPTPPAPPVVTPIAAPAPPPELAISIEPAAPATDETDIAEQDVTEPSPIALVPRRRPRVVSSPIVVLPVTPSAPSFISARLETPTHPPASTAADDEEFPSANPY